MAINFAAVHDRKRWRKHRIHQTVANATDGKDGAKNLLLRNGRVAEMWTRYGNVRCVFVWEDDAENGHAFRLGRDGKDMIQTQTIPIGLLLRFDKAKDCSDQDIDECFKAKSAATDQTEANPLRPDEPRLDVAITFPDDLPNYDHFVEGLALQVLVNRFERSLDARRACLGHYGPTCQICSLDFGERYGPLGLGFIHVHHRVPISLIRSTYRVDPVADLIPVCPNCHAMLHRREPPLQVEELQALLNRS